jgi:hypothetical protein
LYWNDETWLVEMCIWCIKIVIVLVLYTRLVHGKLCRTFSCFSWKLSIQQHIYIKYICRWMLNSRKRTVFREQAFVKYLKFYFENLYSSMKLVLNYVKESTVTSYYWQMTSYISHDVRTWVRYNIRTCGMKIQMQQCSFIKAINIENSHCEV